jgi:exodeoxyribonuclease V alpha subunit
VTPTLEQLREADLISPIDVHAATTWCRIGRDERPEVLAAAALASRALAAGHVCLDLRRVHALVPDSGPPDPVASGLDWPEPGPWREALASSPLVHSDTEARSASGDAVRPLVLDEEDRLYLRRYWDHQERLAAAIRARLDGAGPSEVDADRLLDGLDRLFPRGREEAEGSDLQRVAAEGAVRSRFFVISGGPGTGKTSTVVRILALLVEQALATGERSPRIALLAPTGKAAAHLETSVARSADALDCAPEVRGAIPRDAQTVHRALGARGRPTRYRHDADDPLPFDTVVVDEASMVDLALMSHLVDALRPSARLLLLGDRDQLASVEAGAVLGDIAGAGETQPAATPRPVVHLERSHRFDASSDVGALVRAVHGGDADTVLALLEDPARADASRIEPGDREALARIVREGYAGYAEAPTPAGRLTALDAFRVLCAHRHGPLGVTEHNAFVESLLAAEGVIEPGPGRAWYAGRPLGVTRNDPSAGLYNGDVGLVGHAPGGAGLRVLFLGPDGAERWLSPLRLGTAETVFAMSVHKSQGSEFDAVLVVLPEEPSPIVTRELLYTAVSRARRRVWIRAGRAAIRAALEARVERASGLRDAIWGPAPPMPG